MKNINKFNSISDFKKHRSQDGWLYPSVNYIDTPFEQTLQFNNEFVMRWYDADTAKVPYFSGDLSWEFFRDWVDNASMPCEIKKDGTGFNYLLRSDFNKTATGPDGLTEKGLSHYNTPDKTDYLQMTELKQVNVGLFEDLDEGWKEVRFNFDKGCPDRFHKWFAHPYWNESVGCYTKLWGRYDPTSNTTVNGLNCCYDENQKNRESFGSDNLLKNITLTIKNTDNIKLLEMTYWEHLVLTYIFSAYYKTLDHQTIFKGIHIDGTGGDWTNGQTDVLKTPHGKIVQSPNEPYRFMYMENPLYGKQYIWGAGSLIEGDIKKYWMTFDDLIANETSYLDKNKADISGPFVNSDEVWNYIFNIDLFGIPIELSKFGNSGFYDGIYTNKFKSRLTYLGGDSWDGGRVGSFSRNLNYTSDPNSHNRGRLTMIR